MVLNKNTNTNVNTDDDKINNNINIKIDLGDLAKPKPKPKRKPKPKPKPLDEMKTGATLNTASSTAPVKLGSVKMPSIDSPYNPNTNNLLLLTALQNAFQNKQIQQSQQAPLNNANIIPTQYNQNPQQQQQALLTQGPQQQQQQALLTQGPAQPSPAQFPSGNLSPSISTYNQYAPFGNSGFSTPATLYTPAFTTRTSSPINTQQIPNTNVASTPPEITTQQTLSEVATELQPPELGEWNKDLLKMFDDSKG